MGRFSEKDHLDEIFRRRARRIHDEDIRAANIFLDLHIHFTVGEAGDTCLAEINAQTLTNFVGKRPAGGAGEYLDTITHRSVPLSHVSYTVAFPHSMRPIRMGQCASGRTSSAKRFLTFSSLGSMIS